MPRPLPCCLYGLREENTRQRRSKLVLRNGEPSSYGLRQGKILRSRFGRKTICHYPNPSRFVVCGFLNLEDSLQVRTCRTLKEAREIYSLFVE